MNRRWLTGIGLTLAVVLFLAVNVLGGATLGTARLDLTQNRLYTLSDGTRQILAELTEPLTLNLYVSEKLATGLPGIRSYTRRVAELLEEYRRAAHGKILLHRIDPEPFSVEEDRAVGFGLQGVPIEEGADTFYFGLVGSKRTGQEEVIPFFQPERESFLEYDLTKLIYRLSHPHKPVIGLITTLPIEGNPAAALLRGGVSQPWVVLEQIEQLFEVRTLATELTEIPQEVSVLMVVHPKGLSARSKLAIDQFVLRGGKALIFVDPHAEGDPAAGGMLGGLPGGTASDLPELFQAWGLELTPGKVVGDLAQGKRVRALRQSRNEIMEYPLWIDAHPEYFSHEDIVTGDLDVLAFATPGELRAIRGASTRFEPLVRTSPSGFTIDVDRLATLSDPTAVTAEARPQGQLTLAARISGAVKTAFPHGRPAAEAAAEDQQSSTLEGSSPALVESQGPIQVIVVADTDLLRDDFWVEDERFLDTRLVTATAANGTMVVNALDNLSGNEALISVRNRGTSIRPFTLLRGIEREAEQQLREKERELLSRLRETDAKIRALQPQKRDPDSALLDAAQREELTRLREEKLHIRAELRAVQGELRAEVERLEAWVKFANIGLVPALIGMIGVLIGVRRVRRRKAKAQTGRKVHDGGR